MKTRILLLTTVATTLLALSAFPQGGSEESSDSTWGGEHIELTVAASGAEIEFDCATGTVSKPVPLDSKSEFKLKGTLTREHGGPVRENEPSRVVAATYSGTIENGTMHLKVTVSGKEPYEETFVLQRGHSGRLVKCR
jgi:hypothetical protein